MFNFEKYKDEILAIANQDSSFAKCNGKIQKCVETDCNKCDFGECSCEAKIIKWLYKEEAPTLTRKERAFCEIMKSGYIARDKDERLHFYSNEPTKITDVWNFKRFLYKHIDDTCFQFILWEDDKPWSIVELLKLEVKKEEKNEELEEPEIDWSKVEVDTPIQVSKTGRDWYNRYFCKYEDGKVYAWCNGATSFSAEGFSFAWDFARLI